jgi:4-amino-4-deoxy-L-arabinose transferase-like glycosyltransferase
MNAPSKNQRLTEVLEAREIPLLSNMSLSTIALLAFLIALVAQLTAGWLGLFRTDVLSLDFDEREYWTLSSQILSGEPMEVGRRTLLYPLTLAAVRLLADDVRIVQIVIAVFSATAAPLLAILVNKVAASRTAAALAGLGLALWPPQIFYGTSLYSETIALPAFLLFLIALPLGRGESAKPWHRWVLAGLALGITAHIRTMYQLLLLLLPFVLWLDARRTLIAARRFGLILLGFAVVVLPWSVHVSRALGTPTLLTANGGETLAGGFNPNLIDRGERRVVLQKRSTWDGPGKWITPEESGYLTNAEQEALSYRERDRLLSARAIEWMKSNPLDVAYLAVRKLSYMWGIYPFRANGWLQAIFGNVPTILLLLFFLRALVVEPFVRRWGARLYLMPLFVSGIALISWGSWRFRLPADAAMIGVVAMLVTVQLGRGNLITSRPDVLLA